MKKTTLLLSFFIPLAVAHASTLDLSGTNLPYTDVKTEDEYAIPIGLLTSAEVVQGNPDGTFQPNRTLNRAEFLKIVFGAPADNAEPMMNCFIDVGEQWFADVVCRAKENGIVEGYPDGLFHPERTVNYAEALKILAEINLYALDNEDGAWYEKYLRAAESHGTALTEEIKPGDPLTRGQMAELAAMFLAEAAGELDVYLAAQRGELVQEEESDDPEEEESLDSSESPASSASSEDNLPAHQQHVPTELPEVLDATSHLLILGGEKEPIGMTDVTSLNEPVLLRQIRIRLSDAVSSLSSMEILDEFGYLVGKATIDLAASANRNVYTLSLKPENAYRVDKDAEITFVVMPVLKDEDTGGVSGETVRISQIIFSGTGEWTSRDVIVNTGNIYYQKHETAYAKISSIENAGKERSTFGSGPNRKIGSFWFQAEGNMEADPRLLSLLFSVSMPTEVTLSNIIVRNSETSAESPCTLASSVITCNSIDEGVGTLSTIARRVDLHADVSVSSHPDPFLQVSLSSAGTPDTTGSVTWTDGVQVFGWVDLDEPVAKGTSWE